MDLGITEPRVTYTQHGCRDMFKPKFYSAYGLRLKVAC